MHGAAGSRSRAAHLNKALHSQQAPKKPHHTHHTHHTHGHEEKHDSDSHSHESKKSKEHVPSDGEGAESQTAQIHSILRGSGDHNNEDNKANPKKLYLISCFVVYAVLLSLAFTANFVFFIILCTRNMEYYIRDASYFDVVFDAPTIMLKFIFGNSCHIATTLYTIFALKGAKATESLVLRFRERFLSWIMISAIFGECFIIASVIDYFSSRPLVQNGNYADTILPEEPTGSQANCFKPGIRYRPNGFSQNQIMVNLAWMTEIICKSDKGKNILYDSWGTTNPPTSLCVDFKKKLSQKEKLDCSLATSLDLFMYSHLIIAILGLLYCICLWYIYLRSEVHTKPGRFSIVSQMPLEELYDLRAAAERVKNFTSQQLAAGGTESDQEKMLSERGSKIKFRESQKNQEQAGTAKAGPSPTTKPNVGSKTRVGSPPIPSKTKIGTSPSAAKFGASQSRTRANNR